MAVTAWVRAHPVTAFYALAFAITWLSWWPMALHNRGLVHAGVPGLFFVGGLGPGIAAWVVVRIVGGTRGPAELFRPLLRWRVGARWLVVAVVLWPAIWILSVTLNGTLDHGLTTLGALPVVAVSLVRHLLAAVPEEVGWRGFALPALQERHSALTASLVVGALWALWHLPLLMGGDPTMSACPVLPFVVWMIAEAVLYTWLYNSARGSLLVVVLLHGISNVLGVFSSAPWTTTVITVAAAVIVIAVFGPGHLCRTGSRVTLPATSGRTGPTTTEDVRDASR